MRPEAAIKAGGEGEGSTARSVLVEVWREREDYGHKIAGFIASWQASRIPQKRGNFESKIPH